MSTLIATCIVSINLPDSLISKPIHSLTDLFPFGVSIGDSLVPAGDDIASDISVLKEPITFFESQYREIVVSIHLIVIHENLYMHLLWHVYPTYEIVT